MNEKQKQIFTIEEFQKAKKILVDKIVNRIEKPKLPYDVILGNMRGGFYLADSLSRTLNIPMKICHISFRDNHLVHDDNLLLPNLDVRKRYLFVDDLIDSGATVKYFDGKKNLDFCVLLKNPKVEVNSKVYYYKELEENTWVDFFWEIL